MLLPTIDVVVTKEGHDELSGDIDIIVSKIEHSPDNYEGTHRFAKKNW